MKLFYERDVKQRPLDVVVVGYGSQGRAQALNLRDSGVSVRVALRPGTSRDRAAADGLPVIGLEDAWHADLIQLLVPDLEQASLYERYLAPRLTSQTLMFSHGFAIHHGLIRPPGGCDVVLVAPKAPGKLVRDLYVKGGGAPCLAAVHQDASGEALGKALAYADAIGGTRAGVLETTFREETETDLFGEQAVLCGGVPELVIAGYETLVEAGYQPELAYFECLHELKLIVDLLYEGGLARMHEFVSLTATYGGLSRGGRIVGDARPAMRAILAEIQRGEFGREWVSEVERGLPSYQERLRGALEHPIEGVGKALRSMMREVAP